jgi:hypothetical protein
MNKEMFLETHADEIAQHELDPEEFWTEVCCIPYIDPVFGCRSYRM